MEFAAAVRCAKSMSGGGGLETYLVRTRGDDVILAGKGTAAEGDLNYGLSNILTKPMGTFPACLRT